MALVLLIIEIILLLIGLGYLFLTKSLIDKKTIIFSIPLFIIATWYYALGYIDAYGSISFLGIIESILGTLKSFTFEIEADFVEGLRHSDSIYALGLSLTTLLCGLTLVTSIAGIFKIAMVNYFSVNKKLLFKGADIVIGYDDDAISYCQNSNSVLWINADTYNIKSEDKEKLYLENIPFIYSHIDSKKMNKYIRFIKRKIDVVWFQQKNEDLNNVYEILENIDVDDNRTVEFHVQVNGDHLDFVNQQLTLRCKDKKNIIASAFDHYELISREFSFNYNLAYYLPKGFIENGVLKEDKKISVVMLGFGKTGYAVYKSCLMNNQFVTVKDGKYAAYQIDFHLFDKDATAFNKPLISYYRHQDKYNFKRKNALPPIELTARVKKYVMDVEGQINDELVNIINSDDDHFVFYIVSLSNGLDNTALASKLRGMTSPSNSIIFYNIDYKNESLTGSSNLIPFGYKSEILRHDVITNDELYKLAAINNEAYFKIKGMKPKNFNELDVFEKLSNIYADINLKFKLNILGLDLTNDKDVEGITKEEYLNIYASNTNKDFTYDDYSSYFEINTRIALAYQEHLRWANFYVVNGFNPMNLDEIYYEEGRIIHKNLGIKKHACLTSYEGLDILHKYELQMYLDNGVNKTINDVETYKYDLQLMDNLYDTLMNAGYKIIRK